MSLIGELAALAVPTQVDQHHLPALRQALLAVPEFSPETAALGEPVQ